MKKHISFYSFIFVVAILVVCAFCGCKPQKNTEAQQNSPLDIVATTFPQYDWLCKITKNVPNVSVSLLLKNGVDLHSFQPSAKDMIQISAANMFVYVGGESDFWVEDALSHVADNSNFVAVNLLEALGDFAKTEELVEGMQDDEHEHDDDDDEHEVEHEHEEAYDEHVWLSVRNAQFFCKYLADELAQLDAANADTYLANAQSYMEELIALDAEYTKTISTAKRNVLLFADRFPFRYLADDYNLKYFAAFQGCSAETEANFTTIMFLAEKVDELSLPCVVAIEGSNQKIAKTVISTTKNKNQKIIVLDSMQSVTAKNVSAGASYIKIMQKNLEALSQALN